MAEGAIDGYLDCADSNHGPWDYLGGMLVLLEAGGVVTDLHDRPLLVDDHEARRSPVAAATPELHAALVAAERGDAMTDGSRARATGPTGWRSRCTGACPGPSASGWPDC